MLTRRPVGRGRNNKTLIHNRKICGPARPRSIGTCEVKEHNRNFIILDDDDAINGVDRRAGRSPELVAYGSGQGWPNCSVKKYSQSLRPEAGKKSSEHFFPSLTANPQPIDPKIDLQWAAILTDGWSIPGGHTRPGPATMNLNRSAVIKIVNIVVIVARLLLEFIIAHITPRSPVPLFLPRCSSDYGY